MKDPLGQIALAERHITLLDARMQILRAEIGRIVNQIRRTQRAKNALRATIARARKQLQGDHHDRRHSSPPAV